MSDQSRRVSSGPARDDPVFGDPLAPETPSSAGTPGGGTPSGGGSATDRARQAASTSQEQAKNVAASAGEQARSVASTAKGEAQTVAHTAGEQARRLAGDAREELRNQADSQIQRLAGGVDDLGRQLRSMREGAEPGPASDLVDEVARRAEQVAQRLRDGGVDDVVGQLRNLGRNRPGWFLLGAFGAGLLAGRVARNLAQQPNGSGDAAGRPTVTREELTTESAHAAYGAPYPSTEALPPSPAVAPPSGGPRGQ